MKTSSGLHIWLPAVPPQVDGSTLPDGRGSVPRVRVAQPIRDRQGALGTTAKQPTTGGYTALPAATGMTVDGGQEFDDPVTKHIEPRFFRGRLYERILCSTS